MCNCSTVREKCCIHHSQDSIINPWSLLKGRFSSITGIEMFFSSLFRISSQLTTWPLSPAKYPMVDDALILALEMSEFQRVTTWNFNADPSSRSCWIHYYTSKTRCWHYKLHLNVRWWMAVMNKVLEAQFLVCKMRTLLQVLLFITGSFLQFKSAAEFTFLTVCVLQICHFLALKSYNLVLLPSLETLHVSLVESSTTPKFPTRYPNSSKLLPFSSSFTFLITSFSSLPGHGLVSYLMLFIGIEGIIIKPGLAGRSSDLIT